MSHPFLFLDFFFFPINSEMEEEPVGDVDQSFYPVFSFVMGSMCQWIYTSCCERYMTLICIFIYLGTLGKIKLWPSSFQSFEAFIA